MPGEEGRLDARMSNSSRASAGPVTLPDLTGRRMLITGATSGIGLEASVALTAAGASIVMVGRNPEKTAAAVAEVRERAGGGDVESLLCDFASQKQVRALAAEVLERYDRLHVLVNNAGTVNDTRQVTEEGIEHTFAVNHLGYFLLTSLLLDRLKESAPARIVSVASTGHYRGTLDFDDLGYERGYAIMKAYTRSKLANVMHTRALARRLEGTGVTANALHPGGVSTNIWTGAPWWSKPLIGLAKLFMITPEEGGRTITYLAGSAEVEGKSGGYYHDNVEQPPAKLAQDDALGERLWTVSEGLVGLAG